MSEHHVDAGELDESEKVFDVEFPSNDEPSEVVHPGEEPLALSAFLVAGPHMDVTGPYLQGAPNLFLQMHTLTGPENARATVEFWAAQGATRFKAYDHITRAERKAAIEAAHTKGLKITGHLCSVTYPEAAKLGIDNIEHGFFFNTQLDPGKEPDVCPAPYGGPTLKAMDPDGPAAKALMALLVSKHVAVTSTHPIFEEDGDINPPLQQRALDAMTPQARETYLYKRNADATKNRNASSIITKSPSNVDSSWSVVSWQLVGCC